MGHPNLDHIFSAPYAACNTTLALHTQSTTCTPLHHLPPPHYPLAPHASLCITILAQNTSNLSPHMQPRLNYYKPQAALAKSSLFHIQPTPDAAPSTRRLHQFSMFLIQPGEAIFRSTCSLYQMQPFPHWDCTKCIMFHMQPAQNTVHFTSTPESACWTRNKCRQFHMQPAPNAPCSTQSPTLNAACSTFNLH
jgi:hypothetical protein